MQDYSLMKEIEEFVSERTNFSFIDKVKDLPKYQEVNEKEKQVLQELQNLVANKDSNRLFDELESVVSTLIGLYEKAAYRQGLKDGAKIQQMLG